MCARIHLNIHTGFVFFHRFLYTVAFYNYYYQPSHSGLNRLSQMSKAHTAGQPDGLPGACASPTSRKALGDDDDAKLLLPWAA